MFGSLTRRRRRPIWAWTAVLMLGAVVACVFMASGARSAALEAASTDARMAAQTELATLLEPRDPISPVVGERATELGAAIESEILSVGPITLDADEAGDAFQDRHDDVVVDATAIGSSEPGFEPEAAYGFPYEPEAESEQEPEPERSEVDVYAGLRELSSFDDLSDELAI